MESQQDTHYKFRFSNGASGNVSYGEYINVPDGSKYHVIMCGNYCEAHTTQITM